MQREARPTFAKRCAKPWTSSDERRLLEQLALLRRSIDDAGGLNRWLDVGIQGWLGAPCPVRLDGRSLLRH